MVPRNAVRPSRWGCRRYAPACQHARHVRRPCGLDHEGSDVDILVDFPPGTSMIGIIGIQHELEDLLGGTSPSCHATGSGSESVCACNTDRSLTRSSRMQWRCGFWRSANRAKAGRGSTTAPVTLVDVRLLSRRRGTTSPRPRRSRASTPGSRRGRPPHRRCRRSGTTSSRPRRSCRGPG